MVRCSPTEGLHRIRFLGWKPYILGVTAHFLHDLYYLLLCWQVYQPYCGEVDVHLDTISAKNKI